MSPAEYLQQIMSGFGVSLLANEVTQFFHANPRPTPTDLESFLRIHGAEVYAPNVVKAFTARGYLTITASSLYGEHGASVAAGPHGRFGIAGSKIGTGTGSFVNTPGDGSIVGGHGAGVHQDADGNVILEAGTGGMTINVGSNDVVINAGTKRG